jgi:ribose transport system ATP-binding protein
MVPRSLETVRIRKEYPGTLALDDVSVRFDGGRIHALVGKNGAGKSTLVKIFSGAVRPTAGQVLVDGRPVDLRNPQNAFRQGIAAVYQELSLVPELSVAENILLGRMPRRAGGLVIDWPGVFSRAQRVLDSLQTGLDARRKVARLSVAQRQVVEIAKGMSFDPSVLMLDEPTSALSHHEIRGLFDMLRKLAARGVVVLYITHRLQELREIADTVTVLRDGRHVGGLTAAEASPQAVVGMMFGEVVERRRPADLAPGREPLLEVRNLGRGGKFRGVTFTLHRGEVLGIAGMLGSGRTELLRAIFGAEPCDEGEMRLEGRPVRAISPAQMKARGVAYTPENRAEQSLVQVLSTRANLCLAGLDRIAPWGVITRRRERSVAAGLVRSLKIGAPDLERPVASLSGGNQQKVVVGKWLHTRPRVILFDEPTRGIDVQAKQQIFEIIWDLSRQGIGSLFVSSELEELIEVCHRVLIMKSGRVVESLPVEGLTVEELFRRCME